MTTWTMSQLRTFFWGGGLFQEARIKAKKLTCNIIQKYLPKILSPSDSPNCSKICNLFYVNNGLISIDITRRETNYT